MKKIIICLISLTAALSLFTAGCHSGQTGSGQSLENQPQEITQTDNRKEENLQPAPDTRDELPPEDGAPDMPPPPEHEKHPHERKPHRRHHRKPDDQLPDFNDEDSQETPCSND